MGVAEVAENAIPTIGLAGANSGLGGARPRRPEEAIWAGLKRCLEEQKTPSTHADTGGGHRT